MAGKSVRVLGELGLLEDAAQLPGVKINGILFGSPRRLEARVDFNRPGRSGSLTSFIIRRRTFDAFLFERARREVDTCLEGFRVEQLLMDGRKVCGVRGRAERGTQEFEFRGNIVLGADGYKSVVANLTGAFDPDLRHWYVALRQYYANVGGLTDQIEIHFMEGILPGYLWIFPLESGYANVGIGMLAQKMKHRHVNLRRAMSMAITGKHFRDRFARATPCEVPRGWNLPLGSKRRKMSGEGFLLAGDAAGLIDPFIGEGIPNAMWSGRCAAQIASEARGARDFSAAFLSRYDRTLWSEIGAELRNSSKLQIIGRCGPLVDLTIGKAASNASVRDTIYGMLTHEIPRTRLANPLFYLGLLFR